MNAKFQEIKGNFSEEISIQKQGFEEIIKEFEKMEKFRLHITNIKNSLSNIKEFIFTLNNKFKGVTQTQFSNLIKILTDIKTKLVIRIKSLDSKKILIHII